MPWMFENPVDTIIEWIDLENDDGGEKLMQARIEAYHGFGFTKAPLQKALAVYRWLVLQITESWEVQPHNITAAKTQALEEFKTAIAKILEQRDKNEWFFGEVEDMLGWMIQKMVTDVETKSHDYTPEEIETITWVILEKLSWEDSPERIAANVSEHFTHPLVANMYFFEKRNLFKAHKEAPTDETLSAIKEVITQYYFYANN